MREKIIDIVTRAVVELNETHEKKVPIEQGEAAPLYGRAGPLDSLGLVSLVLAVEQSIESEIGRTITLADERALSQQGSPFRTVGSLATYISECLAEAA